LNDATSQQSGTGGALARNDGDEDVAFKNKHPVFERKTKVVGNDVFLKQIFS
jgi:hypothetical protein